MPPIFTEWWFRPVSSACRVGEHKAVVWKRLNFSPPFANRSDVGVLMRRLLDVVSEALIRSASRLRCAAVGVSVAAIGFQRRQAINNSISPPHPSAIANGKLYQRGMRYLPTMKSNGRHMR